MKRFSLFVLALGILLVPVTVALARKSPGYHPTHSYYRKDGTFVSSYHSGHGAVLSHSRSGRSSTNRQSDSWNSSPSNNFSNNAPAFIPRNTPTPQELLQLKRESEAAWAQQKQQEKVQDEWLKKYQEPGDQQQDAGLLSGKCIEVIDGDTFKILNGQTVVTVRLTGTDAPEITQPFGTQAKTSLSELALGKTLTVYLSEKYRPGHALGWAFAGKIAINGEQIKRGMAWWHEDSAPAATKLAMLQTEARSTHTGLWADQLPVAPWNWRQKQKFSAD